MTRFLSEALQAHEPHFRLALQGLERSHGNSGADIRLTAQIKQQLLAKVTELGLDPHDTTPSELYHSLKRRLHEDEVALRRALQTSVAIHVSAEAKVEAGMTHVLKNLVANQKCFAVKTSSFKTLMRKLPPKKTMKRLGYRSVASFLKHESPAAILTAASLLEDNRWQQNLLAAYKKLTPQDFETRSIAVVQADCHKWQSEAEHTVSERKQNTLCFKELGVVVFLPIPNHVPAGTITANLALGVLALNEISATSTYWKLAQVALDFGSKVQTAVLAEAELNEGLLGCSLPWRTVQHYYSQLKEQFNELVFEPHIQLEDMNWRDIEKVLSHIEPKLSFWHDTSQLGSLHNNHPVSCNVLDVALNLCYNLPFEKRVVHYFQQSLWQELALKYLHPELIEKTVLSDLQPQLATEYAVA